jgi:hypothetical protein
MPFPALHRSSLVVRPWMNPLERSMRKGNSLHSDLM